MSTPVSTLIVSLVRSLEDALAVVEERRLSSTEERSRRDERQAEYRSRIEDQCARPSPFIVSADAGQSTREGGEFLDVHAPEKRYSAQSELQIRWETALCDAETVLRQLYLEPLLRPVVELVAELIRTSRLVSAAGPELVSPDTRRNMEDYLRSELTWSQAQLKEMGSLSPDVTEEEVAPSMREGLQRSVGFLDRIYDYLGEQQQATERWEAARAQPLQEALLQLRSLETQVSNSRSSGS